MNDGKVISNIFFPTTEESESCFAQPKPCTLGRESTVYGKIQKERIPPLEKLKISVVSTANGVKSLHEQPLAKDAADPPVSMEKTQPLEGLKESGPPEPGSKDDTPGAEEKKKDVEAVTEDQPLRGNAETEPLGTEAKHQPLRTAGERDSPGVVGGTEDPQTGREMKPLGIAENIPPREAGREPQPQEAMGKDEQPQLPETVLKETESPEILEGSHLVETTPEGPGNMEQVPREGTVGSTEHPAGILETGTNVEMVRKTHSNKEDQTTDGKVMLLTIQDV